MSDLLALSLILLTAAVFCVAYYFYRWIIRKEVMNPKVKDISNLIAQGSKTFLRQEYTILAKFTLVVVLIIFMFLPHPSGTPISSIISSWQWPMSLVRLSPV